MARSKAGGHPRGWRLVDNPSWADRVSKGEDAYEFCHDGTPFLTLRCECGQDLHLHRGQVEAAPATVTIIAARCASCRRPLEFGRQWLLDALERAWAPPVPA